VSIRVQPWFDLLRIGNCANPALLAWLEPLLPAIIRQLENGERLIETR
jgi:hypothetical protein